MSQRGVELPGGAGGVPGYTATGAYVWDGDVQNIASATWTEWTADEEAYDFGGLHVSPGTAKFTIPAGRAVAAPGTPYLFMAMFSFQASVTGVRGVRIKYNGSVYAMQRGLPGDAALVVSVICSTIINVVVTDVITAECWQNSGLGLNSDTAEVGNYFSCQRLQE